MTCGVGWSMTQWKNFPRVDNVQNADGWVPLVGVLMKRIGTLPLDPDPTARSGRERRRPKTGGAAAPATVASTDSSPGGSGGGGDDAERRRRFEEGRGGTGACWNWTERRQ